MISLSSFRKAKSRLNLPASGVPLDAGETLLTGMVGWWDGLTYSGSGAWLNKGTTGSAINMALGAGAAAPTFSTDHFEFDGSNDFMSCSSHADLNFALANSFSIGAVIRFTATPTNFGRIIDKRGTVGWTLESAFTTLQTRCVANDGTNSLSVDAPVGSLNTKFLTTFVRNVSSDNGIGYLNSTGSTPVTDPNTATLASSDPLWFGAWPSGNFSNVHMYAAFVHRGVLTTQNLTDIAAHYGI